jgi:hypothetical protein
LINNQKERRNQRCQALIDNCNLVFDDSITKKCTFYDANMLSHFGEVPPTAEVFDEPWTCWKDIPDEVLDANSYLLTYFDFDEVLFYVAAFMRLTLKDTVLPNRDLPGVFEEDTLLFIGKNYEHLSTFDISEKQIKFIHDFVLFHLEDQECDSSLKWLNFDREIPIENIIQKYEE